MSVVPRLKDFMVEPVVSLWFTLWGTLWAGKAISILEVLALWGPVGQESTSKIGELSYPPATGPQASTTGGTPSTLNPHRHYFLGPQATSRNREGCRVPCGPRK